MLQVHMHELQQRRLAEQVAGDAQSPETDEDVTENASIKISKEVPVSDPEQRDSKLTSVIKIASAHDIKAPEARAVKSIEAAEVVGVRPEPESTAIAKPTRHPVEAPAVRDKKTVARRPDDLVELPDHSLAGPLNGFAAVMSQERDIEMPEVSSIEIGLTDYMELGGEGMHSEDITELHDILIAVINARSERTLDAAFEASGEMHEGVAVSVAREIETAEQATFEEYIASASPIEDIPTMEYINSMAEEDQPLEEMLAQLAVYLEDAPKDEALAIKQILAEIKKELPAYRAEDQPVETILTKNITQRLLSLLREVGYEEPERTLYIFFASHDLDFLLQAIQYLHQLTNDDNQQEAKHFSLTSLMAGNSRSTQFASSIFALIAEKLGIRAGLSDGIF